MISRKVICEELEKFKREHGMERQTYETKMLHIIFELMLDMRDLELRPLVATVGEKKKGEEVPIAIKDFLVWLKEEDRYPIENDYEMMIRLETFEHEIETSSEKEVNVL